MCLDVGHSAGCLAKQGKMCLDVGHSAGCLAKQERRVLMWDIRLCV